MKMNQVLLGLLVVIGIVMIYLGYKASMKPPMLTGVGFFIIAYVLNKLTKK
jgi:hypothetical protein